VSKEHGVTYETEVHITMDEMAGLLHEAMGFSSVDLYDWEFDINDSDTLTLRYKGRVT